MALAAVLSAMGEGRYVLAFPFIFVLYLLNYLYSLSETVIGTSLIAVGNLLKDNSTNIKTASQSAQDYVVGPLVRIYEYEGICIV